MRITLNNGSEFFPFVVIGAKAFVQGVNRDTLTFVFSGNENMDELDAHFSPENCENITIQGDDGHEYIYKGYTIRFALKRAPVEVEPATEETEAVYEDRVTVSMAQRTYLENQTAEMAAAMNALLNGEG